MKFGFYSFIHSPVTYALFDPSTSIRIVSALCSKSLISASHVEVFSNTDSKISGHAV
jgi:hypothetical protein